MVRACLIANRVEPARAQRIIRATLENIRNWEQRLIEIEQTLPPGGKARVLALMRDVEHARLSLCRLAKMEGEDACQFPADKKPHET